MSAIARVLHERGEQVTGCDRQRSPYLRALESDGVVAYIGHDAAHVAGVDLLLVSSAVPTDNPEVVAARQAGIPVLRRQDFLPQLTAGHRTVAVAGTHGKTTTSALIAWLLLRAGLDPSFVVGGRMTDLGTNARAGQGSLFVIEADEYDRAFLGLQPAIAVITNVEHDHPDCYPTQASFRAAFEDFVARVREMIVVCADDPGAAALESGGIRKLTYGLSTQAEWRAEEVRPNTAGGMDFLLLQQGELLGIVRTRLPGEHNVRNTLAALAVSDALGVPFTLARDALTEFHGVGRRFQVVGQAGGVTVVDDYAHHPTEIRATLAAARARFPQAELWAVFQPHTYSRARTFIQEYREAFSDADHVIVLEVFAAREKPDPEWSGEAIASSIEHRDVRFIAGNEAAAQALQGLVAPGAVVVTLSAGDGNQVGDILLRHLREQEGGKSHG